ncbi:hypothetical protein V1511DRAFT_36329 [Dipodascopsis uninucleata]
MIIQRIERLALGREFTNQHNSLYYDEQERSKTIEAAASARDLENRLLLAQSNICSSVGLNLRENVSDIDIERQESWQNSLGIGMLIAGHGLNFILLWPLDNIETLLQVYRTSENISYLAFVRSIWKVSSWSQLFAGITANVCYQVFSSCGDIAGFLVSATLANIWPRWLDRSLINTISSVFSGFWWYVTTPFLELEMAQTLRLDSTSKLFPSVSMFKRLFSLDFLRINGKYIGEYATLLYLEKNVSRVVPLVINLLPLPNLKPQMKSRSTRAFPELVRSMLSMSVSAIISAPFEAIIYRQLARRLNPFAPVYKDGEIGNWRIMAQACLLQVFASWTLSEIYFGAFYLMRRVTGSKLNVLQRRRRRRRRNV